MKKKQTAFYVLLLLFAATIVALDQWTKHLVETGLALNEHRASILGIFHITHTQNDGGAWGSFGGHTWLFVLVMVLFVALLGVAIWKKWLTKKIEWVCLAAILGGGIGNVIDRLFKDGLVTDMICLDFMKFPVFNLADCFITCGCVALMIYVIFFDREKKEEKPAKESEKEE